MVDVSSILTKIRNGPPWLIPALAGGALGAYTLYRRRAAPVAVAPVAAVVPPRASSSAQLPDIQGLLAGQTTALGQQIQGLKDSQPDWQTLFQDQAGVVRDLSANITTQQQKQNDTFTAALAALSAAEQQGFAALAAKIGAQKPAPVDPILPPAVPPAAPPPSGGGGLAPTSGGSGGDRPIVPPVMNPAPPPPVTTAGPTGGAPGVTGVDWAAFAAYLGGQSWVPGGLHYAGEQVIIRWDQPPFNAGGGPPSGNYPTLSYPVNFNGAHSTKRYPFDLNPFSESAFIRTLRWTADYMSTHSDANPTVVWDGMIGRLMRDTGPCVDSSCSNWYVTGWDFGSVKDSPFLDGQGTPNPAFIAY